MNNVHATPPPQYEVWELSEDLNQLIEKIKASGSVPLIAIVPDAQKIKLQKLAGYARSSATDTVVRWHVSKLGPLGRAVLREMAQAMRPNLDVGAMLEVLENAEKNIDDYAILSSVSKLQHPAPNLWQHLTSALPNTTFVAKVGAGVSSVNKLKAQLQEPQTGSYYAFQHVSEQASKRLVEICNWLVSAYGAEVVAAPPISDAATRRHWGKEDGIEICFAPKELEAIVNNFHLRSWACRWCGCLTVQQRCRFCGSQTVK